jgi:prepilin-type N-terminal cleavage/methylation domain-containing protein
MRPSRADARRDAGFTLVELLVAIFLLGTIMTFVYQILWNAVMARDLVTEDLEGPKVETAIFDQIARDLRFLYFEQGRLPGDSGFWGRSKQMNGRDIDRLDFLTARTTRVAQLEEATEQPGDSPLTEVGYALRQNEKNPRWFELWRREDYFVDDDPTDGGKYSLVYDKIRRFNLRYFTTPEKNDAEQGLEEWDSKEKHNVPYAIILDMLYDVREPAGDREQAKVAKILLMKPGRSVDPKEGTAMAPMR